jgi:hypothetical protein
VGELAKETIIKMQISYLTTLLAAGAAAVAIVAAPTALADTTTTTQSCDTTNTGAECQTPGNVQIDDAPRSSASTRTEVWAWTSE